MKLIVTPNLDDADGIYEQLIDLHRERSDQESMRINARLILILLNHIGDDETIREAIKLAGPQVRH